MRNSPRLFRLTATVAVTALLWDTALPLAAVAQPAPPPLPATGQGRPDLNQGDPPERVGRVASMTGAVSFHNPGDTQWSAVTPNYPVSSGNSFWTEPAAEARLQVSDSSIAMAGGTEFDVSKLDASGLQGVAAQGEIYLRLRDLVPNEAWSVQTPRGLVQFSSEGRYDIVAGTTDQPTLVTVVDGSAQIEGPGVSLRVASGQTATITGADSFEGSVGAAVRDAFLTARLDAERPRPASGVAPPPQVVAMSGGSDLADTGTWSQAPEYGRVWYPPVPATWVPYREGHWAYVAPWGWTWVDDASWGFAPFHYGRWLQVDGRWAWTPGEVAVAVAGPPVYAPALVTFIGIGAGVALGAALAAGSIGWVPLGPREPFHPWYHASNNYVRQVNITHVTNISNINNNVTINNYINRGAATSVPAAAMTGSRPVQAVARPVTAQEFAAARPVIGQQPVRPTAATAGVTPVVAHELHLAPAAAEHPAPGPAVRPQPAGAVGFVRPALSPAGRPGSAEATRPAGPGVRPVGETTPEAARPAVVAPGSKQPGSVPEPGRPPAAAPVPARPGIAAEPNRPAAIAPEAARPGGVAAHPAQPSAAKPAAAPAVPNAAPAAPRPAERPATEPARPEVRPVARPAPDAEHAPPRAEVPRTEAPRAAVPPAPRAEPLHAAPSEPRAEPPRAEPPRAEPPRAAPPAPRPEPARAAPPAARPEPKEQKKEPVPH